MIREFLLLTLQKYSSVTPSGLSFSVYVCACLFFIPLTPLARALGLCVHRLMW